MKNFRILAAVAAFIMITVSSNAQGPKQGNWQDRVMAEKIAFITSALELTPEEAQTFWPVYNQIEAQKKETQKVVKEAYKALTKALEEGTASDKEIDRLLDNYLAAKQAQKESGKGDATKFRKVLSSQKVAKLYIAEENFRRHHIRNMKASYGPKGGSGKPGPRR
jgi:hypothetical protein